jgi:hypothetical protein
MEAGAVHMPPRRRLFNGRTGAGAMTEWDKGVSPRPEMTADVQRRRFAAAGTRSGQDTMWSS